MKTRTVFLSTLLLCLNTHPFRLYHEPNPYGPRRRPIDFYRCCRSVAVME